MENKDLFESLKSLNVNEKTEKKNGLTYLSWAWAWAEFKKACPNAVYEVVKFNGLPYVYDEKTGYMVYTTVTAGGITHEMWLPVMDGANNAMKAEPYVIKTRYKEIQVAEATMFDVNKAIMRCLTKNLAMFGLGLYIYAGEDLPEDEERPKDEQKSEKAYICSECGEKIQSFTDAKGKTYTAEEMFKLSIKRSQDGNPRCTNCMIKASKKAKTKPKTIDVVDADES